MWLLLFYWCCNVLGCLCCYFVSHQMDTVVMNTTEWIHRNIVPEKERIQLLREMMSFAVMDPNSSTFDSEDRLVWASPQHWSRRFEWPWVIHEAKLNKNRCILDIGGCWSVVEYLMATRAEWVNSIEYDWDALKKGEEAAFRMGFHNISHAYGDARNLPYTDNTFDVVSSISVLEHIPNNHAQCIREMLRVLRPGGKALITMDVKLEGVREGNSFITRENLPAICSEAGTPYPSNPITMTAQLNGDDTNPLVFTVLLIRLEKE